MIHPAPDMCPDTLDPIEHLFNLGQTVGPNARLICQCGKYVVYFNGVEFVSEPNNDPGNQSSTGRTDDRPT
jgi:hypothetical protein